MEGSKVPRFLYKYMDLSSFAMILRTGKLRLNALTKMDDLQEEQTHDKADWGRFCYISSWVAECREMIPMWKMYCSSKSGIRLKLKSMPFKEQIYTRDCIDECKSIFNQAIKPNDHGNIPIEYLKNDEILPYDTHVKLCKVKYSNKEEDLNPKVMYPDIKRIDFSKIGLVKNSYWKFQKEWRYVIGCLPSQFGFLIYDGISEQKLASRIKKCPVTKTCIEIPLSEDAFVGAEILLAPDISEGNREIVKYLSEECHIRIKESCLTGLIR